MPDHQETISNFLCDQYLHRLVLQGRIDKIVKLSDHSQRYKFINDVNRVHRRQNNLNVNEFDRNYGHRLQVRNSECLSVVLEQVVVI